MIIYFKIHNVRRIKRKFLYSIDNYVIIHNCEKSIFDFMFKNVTTNNNSFRVPDNVADVVVVCCLSFKWLFLKSKPNAVLTYLAALYSPAIQ